MTILLAFLALFLGLAGCKASGPEPRISLERMIDQSRYDPYEATQLFADGKVMREPPPGTVPREMILGPPLLVSGHDGNRFADHIPLPIDRALLDHGRSRFTIYCAACHGELGNGQSPIAERMTLRRPPSLVDPPKRDLVPGKVFQVATEGYGLMPSYAPMLSVEERWAVVAYIEVLRLAREARLADLPESLRQRALEALQPQP